MSLIQRLNPAGGIADFWQEFRKPTPYRWPILAVSVSMTAGLMFLIIREDVVGPPVPPDVTYITSFAADRTDEEIIATNLIYQAHKEKRDAMIAAREERKKEIYRALARASGMNPREIEKKAAEQMAREDAEAARLRAVALGQIEADEAAAADTPGETAPSGGTAEQNPAQ
ncbi:hypothetical protein QWY75_08500 [Pontixanthobacter aestiaquae]|uniref:Uncharacterized protein n=1 Tax=Pontixanthobacter aestiaquae TaxID=1509367 RepID=A0A844ZA81_9SPHN|nr:hypothetical protein [Pontixanthobacter aestiaquae]MDN3646239.1 hypothetical protein [Pontixanthobacter aestiaquae]MXO82769.1 hypothetical protein [Pontixanthobacter aestiaquae]